MPELGQDTKRRTSLRRKLLRGGILLSTVPLALAAGVSYWVASGSLRREALDQLQATRDSRAYEITNWFHTIGNHVRSLGVNPGVKDAMRDLSKAWADLPAARGLKDGRGDVSAERKALERELKEHYRSAFTLRYETLSGRKIDAETLVPTEDAGMVAQSQYISSNPQPMGSKGRLDRPAGDVSEYGAAHQQYHQYFGHMTEAFGYFDLYLVDRATSTVVYSVQKQVDFGTNLAAGPHRDSGLASVVRAAFAPGAGAGAVFEDFRAYVPSYGVPAAFVATVVQEGGETVGAVVVQLPVARLNEVMSHSEGLGETGETYVVGKDKLMRSDSRFDKESSVLKRKVDTVFAREALAGNTGTAEATDYRGHEVFAAYQPLNDTPFGYGLVAKVDQEEALAPVRRLMKWMIGLGVVLLAGAFVVSWKTASSLAAPVTEVSGRLQGLAQQLHSTSQEQQAGAAEQSAAVEETRQTFGGLLESGKGLAKVGSDVLSHAEIGLRNAQTIGTRIRELSGHTAQITEILSLVKDIANKSEILALNAALEGTKAGEAGRGFSLVATQMQRLAEQVMGSVKKIEGLTSDIAKSSHGAVLAAEEAEKVANLTTESARSISQAVALQQSSTEQVSVAMDEISQVAQRNVDAARKIVGSANDLIAFADHLRATLGTKEG